MALEDIQRHHRRFLRISDQFKALWTFHQMLQAIYRHYFDKSLPYSLQFKELYDTIKTLPSLFQGLPPAALARRFESSEEELANFFTTLQETDKKVAPSHLRMFFEQRINTEDQDKILYQIIKFYLYGQLIDTQIRDKVDFLITHLSSLYSTVENKFILRDRNHLKNVFEKLMTVGAFPTVDEELKGEYMTLLQELRQEVITCETLEDFVLSGILKAIRGLKARMGETFLHPDILLKVAELNVATKNRYTDIYRREEQKLLEDTTRIKRMTQEGIISSPDLVQKVGEIEKMHDLLFTDNKPRDIKIEHLAEYKNSVKRILEELDTKFTFNINDAEPPPAPVYTSAEDEPYDTEATIALIMQLGSNETAATGFRLEDFELSPLQAYHLLHSMDLLQEKDNLLLRSTILRYHIDLIVSDLLDARRQGMEIEPSTMNRADKIIQVGQDLEKQFQWHLDEALFQGNQSEVQILTRAKYRLSRSLSGLWLLYDSLNPHPS